MKELLFSYPCPANSRITGPLILIVRLVKEANKRGLIPYVIDIKGGNLFRMLKEMNLKIHPVFYEELIRGSCKSMSAKMYYWPIFYGTNNFWVMDVLSKSKYFQISSLIWFIHPENMINGFPVLSRISKSNPKIRQIIAKLFYREIYTKHKVLFSKLIDMNGLVFMDDGNYLYNKNFFSLKQEASEMYYLPVPVDLNDKNLWLDSRHSSNKLIFGWLGNFVDFKLPIIIKVLQDIDKAIKDKKRVRCLIIGKGESKNLLLKSLKKLEIEKSVEFIPVVTGYKLDQELLKMDLLFAMGTSALEGAKLGVPTILVDGTYAIPNNYKYKWIFETHNYSLGRLLYKNNIPSENQHSMEDILFNGNLEEMSMKSFEYTKRHDVKKVFSSLLSYLEKSSFSLEFLDKMELFESIRNSAVYKLRDLKQKILRDDRSGRWF